VPANGKPITVIDLAAVPAEILDVVISLIARIAFDLAVWSEGTLPMLLVCEEAHRYAPAGAGDKSCRRVRRLRGSPKKAANTASLSGL